MMIKQAITLGVMRELDSCVECNTCLDNCPVYSKNFSVKTLNNVIKKTTQISSDICDFTFACIQCRKCVPVCPEGLHRDEMVLMLKHALRHQKPRSYSRYVLIRGPKLSIFRAIIQGFFVFYQKLQNPKIKKYMESTEDKPNSLLFYPGCYIYSPNTINQTIKLLDHVGNPYSVLAGLTQCCGMPYYLQGDFQQTEKCLANLKKHLQIINPTVVISGCNECLEAIQLINKYFHTSYITKTVVEYLYDHIEEFPKKSNARVVTFQDACRYNRGASAGESSRKVIKHFGNIKEMKHTKTTAVCCAHWNFEAYNGNNKIRKDRLNEAKKAANQMACECLTCYERFSKIESDVKVIDVLDLFEQSLDAQKPK